MGEDGMDLYTRRPPEFGAIRLTGENLREVAGLCGGVVSWGGVVVEGRFVLYEGDWLVEEDGIFVVYSDGEFNRLFVRTYDGI